MALIDFIFAVSLVSKLLKLPGPNSASLPNLGDQNRYAQNQYHAVQVNL